MIERREESNAAYHGNHEYISRSRLCRFSVCPAYYKYYEDHDEEETDALAFGSAFHKYVLEREDFDTEFTIIKSKRTNEGKAAIEEAKKNGKTAITQEDFGFIQGMAAAVESNPFCRKLLDGRREESFYYEDDGVKCKVRPDCYKVIGDKVIITDLKSCVSAREPSKSMEKYGYDVQSAMYPVGVGAVLGINPNDIQFCFIFVEKKPPFLVNVCQVDTTVRERGYAKYTEYLGTYKECLATGDFYGLNGKNNDLTIIYAEE